MELKTFLEMPPTLTVIKEGAPSFLYLSMTNNAISYVLVWELDGGERLIYFVSEVFKGRN